MAPPASIQGARRKSTRGCSRRAFVLAVLTTLVGRSSARATALVPPKLQAQLLDKVVLYDKNYPALPPPVRVLLVMKQGQAASMAVVREMELALAAMPELGKRRHEVQVVGFAGVDALAALCRARSIGVVYVGPSLDEHIRAIGHALTGSHVLTVGAEPSYVPEGVVLGFDLVSGRPKLVVNLEQAKAQSVEFRAEILKLMRVYR